MDTKGMAGILVVILLVAAVVVATFLVQQQTNLLPKAHDELSVSCVPDKNQASIGDEVVWRVDISGGVSPYGIKWSGSDGLTSEGNIQIPSTNPQSLSITYSTPGVKTASVRVAAYDDTIEPVTVNCSTTNISSIASPNPTPSASPTPSGGQQAPAEQLSLVCNPSTTTATVGQQITIRADANGGTRPYKLSWGGNDTVLSRIGDNDNNVQTVTFSTSGVKNAIVRVSDSANSQKTIDCPAINVTSASGGTASPPANNMVVSCSPNKEKAYTGEEVRWSASVSGGVEPYYYEWRSGNNDEFSLGGAPLPSAPKEPTTTYSTPGSKTAQVFVTDARGSQFKAGGNCTKSVDVASLKITGKVFVDKVNVPPLERFDGTLDNGDLPAENEQVILYEDSAGSQVVAIARSNSAGEYRFDDLSPGSYRVTHFVPSGYRRTTDDSHYKVDISLDRPLGIANIGYTPSTVSYKLAETESGLADSVSIPYSQPPITTIFQLSNNSPGAKQIWVQYLTSDQKTHNYVLNLTMVLQDPVVDSLDCTQDLTKENLRVTLRGRYFSSGGQIFLNGTAIRVLEWKDGQVSAIWDRPGNSNPIADGTQFKIKLTRSDNVSAPEQTCAVNKSLISLGAKVFCRTPGQFDVNNVEVSLIDQGNNRVKEKVTIDKEGVVQGLQIKLNKNQRYLLSIKAPYSLRRNAIFTAGDGTTVVTRDNGDQFILPVGDIAPVITQDGKINTIDKAELTRQWRTLDTGSGRNASGSATLSTGDFNRDGKVNSIDWACMRYDFNQSDNEIPASIGNLLNPTPSPTPSPSVSPSPSVCATPPACTNGTPIAGDPDPNDPNNCPRYSCPSPSPAATP